MRCPNCSTELPPNVSRCPQCGELVSLLSDWWPSFKEQASKEKTQGDENVREHLARGKNQNEDSAREQAAKERLAREQAAREQAAKERAAREQSAREQAAKEESARQQASRERAAREQVAKERLEREQTSREQAIRDRLMREQAAWDQGPVAGKEDKSKPLEVHAAETVENKNTMEKLTNTADAVLGEKGITERSKETETTTDSSKLGLGASIKDNELNNAEVKQDSNKTLQQAAKEHEVKAEQSTVKELSTAETVTPDMSNGKDSEKGTDKMKKPEEMAASTVEQAPKSLLTSNLSRIDFSLNSPIWLWSVAIIGLILLGLGFNMLFNRPKAEMNYPVSPWPMYRYDARHTGLSPFNGPKKPKLAWNYPLQSAFKTDPLVAVDGKLYIVAGENLCLVKTDGTKDGNGTITLRSAVGNGSAAADSEVKAAVEGAALSEKNRKDSSIMYLTLSNNRIAVAKTDGTVLKTCTAAGHILYSPILGPADVIYIVSQPSKHHIALEAISPFGIKMWAYQVEAAGNIVFSPPAVDGEGTAYVGASNGNVYAVNFDGSERWTFQAEAGVDVAPAIGRDGTLYVSSKNRLYAIDPQTGTEQWSVDLPNAGHQAIGVDSTIYVATVATTGGGKLYAFTPDGSKKWEWQTTDNLSTAPVISGDSTVYLGSESGKVYAVNKDGKKLWELQAAQMPIISSPIIGVDNTIYVWSGDSIYAIQEDK